MAGGPRVPAPGAEARAPAKQATPKASNPRILSVCLRLQGHSESVGAKHREDSVGIQRKPSRRGGLTGLRGGAKAANHSMSKLWDVAKGLGPHLKDAVETWGPAYLAYRQANAINYEQVAQNDRIHKTEIAASKEFHVKETALNIDMYRRDMQLSKQQHLMSTIADIELNLLQMQADRFNSQKESVRDMYDQRNQQLQTIIIAASLMMTGCITLLFNGVLPEGTPETATISFGAVTGSAFALLFVSIVLCIETLRLASRFMYKRAHQDKNQATNLLKKGEEAIKAITGIVDSSVEKQESASNLPPNADEVLEQAKESKCTPGTVSTKSEVKDQHLDTSRKVHPGSEKSRPMFTKDTYYEPSNLPPYVDEVLEQAKEFKCTDDTVSTKSEVKDQHFDITRKVWEDIENRRAKVATEYFKNMEDNFEIEDREITVSTDCKRYYGRLIIGFVNHFFCSCKSIDKRRRSQYKWLENKESTKRRRLVDFEDFWEHECDGFAKGATTTFYMGTALLLTAVCIWCWAQFSIKYSSSSAAIAAIVTIGTGFLFGFAYYLVIAEAGEEGMWKEVADYKLGQIFKFDESSKKRNPVRPTNIEVGDIVMVEVKRPPFQSSWRKGTITRKPSNDSSDYEICFSDLDSRPTKDGMNSGSSLKRSGKKRTGETLQWGSTSTNDSEMG